MAAYWRLSVGEILFEAAFGWWVWGMWTQVVVWCVWYPAWLVGATVLAVSFFVPVVAGLYSRRARAIDALAAVGGGVLMVAVAIAQHGAVPSGIVSLYGLAGAFVAFGVAVFFIRSHA